MKSQSLRVSESQRKTGKGGRVSETLRLCGSATIFLALLVLLSTACSPKQTVVVGSKNFTESVLLGEIVAQRLESAGCKVDRKLDLGGTLVCDKAITTGDLDVYPEYSGTALTAILKLPISSDRAAVTRSVEQAYAKRDLKWGPQLGFENTFAIIVRRADAERHGLRTITDLAKVADTFRPGFGYEFVERPDGWSGLQQHYGLRFVTSPKTMDLGLTYRALAANSIDVIAGNSTDGLIDALGLVVLEDDKRFFPPYDTAIVSRTDLGKKCAAAPAALESLANAFDEPAMRRLNQAIDGDKRPPAEIAREALARLRE
ncbi:MAG TPA: glycine betaine ABC transporter substrate-binding protein [Thermoanaerobaculia bacterium]|nr:glycine betaine ABC transporter substrate-binding protein [Thermoanaerobaculia bacterium]